MRTLPRLRILPPLHALKVLASSLIGNDSPIKTAGGDGQIDGIERQLLKVPLTDSDAVSYLQQGAPEGRRVVFVHGTPGNAKGWADYLLADTQGRLHIAVDRLGYGCSGPGRAVVSLERQACAIAPFLETRGGRRTILVGHSSGASVAVRTALDFPDRVGGLLLLAGALDPDLEEANCLQPLVAFGPVSRLLPRAIDTANRELLGLRRELMALAGRLHALHMPVGVVHGDMDPLVPVANVDYLERMATSALIDMVVLPEKDHFIPWHSKPEVDAALERLIDRVRKTET